MTDFNSLSFHHIFRELNYEADVLSKTCLGDMDGRIFLSICSEGYVLTDTLSFFRSDLLFSLHENPLFWSHLAIMIPWCFEG